MESFIIKKVTKDLKDVYFSYIYTCFEIKIDFVCKIYSSKNIFL